MGEPTIDKYFHIINKGITRFEKGVLARDLMGFLFGALRDKSTNSLKENFRRFPECCLPQGHVSLMVVQS